MMARWPRDGVSMSRLIVVKAAFDGEAGVWYIESSDLFGLHIEAATMERLIRKLPGAVADLLEDDPEFVAAGGGEVPIELIAHTTVRVGMVAAA
jgi:hypothetical protein